MYKYIFKNALLPLIFTKKFQYKPREWRNTLLWKCCRLPNVTDLQVRYWIEVTFNCRHQGKKNPCEWQVAVHVGNISSRDWHIFLASENSEQSSTPKNEYKHYAISKLTKFISFKRSVKDVKLHLNNGKYKRSKFNSLPVSRIAV